MMRSVAICAAALLAVAAAMPADLRESAGNRNLDAAAVGRNVSFSGRNWAVKNGFYGPGPCHFTDNKNNVWVDSQGRLHLTIQYSQSLQQWQVTEVQLFEALGYGNYTFDVGSPVDNLGNGDLFPVLGLFVYRDLSHEIDIEFARWNSSGNPHNADNAVQPYTLPHQVIYWTAPPGYSRTIHTISWTPGHVLCTSGGMGVTPYHSWTFNNATTVPGPDGVLVHINLWLFRGYTAMPKSEVVEVILNNFSFTPYSADE